MSKTQRETLDDIRHAMIDEGAYYILPETKSNIPTFEDINNGYCRVFAFRSVQALKNIDIDAVYHEIEYRTVPHTFIQIGRKYFDADCIDGVFNYRNLPLLKSLDREAAFHPIKTFLIWFDEHFVGKRKLR
jgi:hypothetical protein